MGRVALSTGLAGMSGTVGDLVLEQRPGGIVAKARRTGRTRRTPAMRANERRLSLLSLAWHALDGESFAAWRRLAEDSAVRNPATGAWVVPNPYNLFCRYAGKVRQVDPEASLEGFRPPGSPFGGDGVAVTVSPSGSPSFRSGERKGLGDGEWKVLDLRPIQAEGVTTPSTWDTTPADSALKLFASCPSADPPTVPPGARDEGFGDVDASAPRLQGEPSLRFAADRANAEGVVTELLTQPLVNARRRVYADRYVSRGFFAFAGPGTVEVPCEVGAWACAYRFVRPATGQQTGLFELGVVEIRAE